MNFGWSPMDGVLVRKKHSGADFTAIRETATTLQPLFRHAHEADCQFGHLEHVRTANSAVMQQPQQQQWPHMNSSHVKRDKSRP